MSSRIDEKHEHVMTVKDQDVADELKNEFLDLCLKRKANALVALSAARCAAECFESIINEQCGEVFTVPTAPTETSARCGECGSCHHSGPLNEEGRCMVDISAYVDPEGPFHGMKECYCKCVFPASTEVVGERQSSRELTPEQEAVFNRECFDRVCEQRNAWIKWGYAMLDRAGVKHHQPDQWRLRAALSRLIAAPATPVAQPEADPVDIAPCRVCASVPVRDRWFREEGVVHCSKTSCFMFERPMSLDQWNRLMWNEPSTTTPTIAAVEAAKEIADNISVNQFREIQRFNRVEPLAAIISKHLPARQPATNFIHLPQYPLNGTQLECDGSKLRADGTCTKCERINDRIESIVTAEVERLKGEVERLTALVAALEHDFNEAVKHGDNE